MPTKSVAWKMHKSGKERLDYEVCRECTARHESANREDYEYFGNWFIGCWERHRVPCGGDAFGETADPFKSPPKWCEFKLEHVMGMQKCLND